MVAPRRGANVGFDSVMCARDLKRIQSGRPGPARPAIFGPARTGQNQPEIPGRPANFWADPNGPARSGPDKRVILIQVPNLNSCYQINVLLKNFNKTSIKR